MQKPKEKISRTTKFQNFDQNRQELSFVTRSMVPLRRSVTLDQGGSPAIGMIVLAAPVFSDASRNSGITP